MILSSKETTVAYRCPACGKMIFGIVGIFSLSGDMIKLKCDCGCSEMAIVRTSDGKLRLTVPCVVCSSPHNFVLDRRTFFGSDVFHLSCTYSGIDICLVGEKDGVVKAAKEADEEFLRVLKEAGIPDFQTFVSAKEADDAEHSDKVPDPEMQSVVHFMLCELEDEGNITCKCRDRGHYEFKFVGKNFDSVLIYCTECSASVSVPLTDTLAAEAFLRIDKLRLT